ncbi:PSD1 and planctomycete cytochrome C domain-containing protein [Crateriforma spongiae]|uniref:PSD1 and planctomycete cytochrome C domain-containing protein n=1 Tax=Crateriforma spongiae TaxID=2724528 RepID=UPI001444A2CF|nr:PSD1 and planctomycete cytochrome C domain-containing protein [Crateriforma spongiae]
MIFRFPTTRLLLVIAGFAIATGVGGPSAHSDDRVDFERDILPILEDHCQYCHGEDEQESGLRLDRRAMMLRGGDYGQPAVVPGDPDGSYLMTVVTHAEPGMEMPPDDDKLSDEKIDLLRRWIQQGAQWPGQMDDVVDETIDHWAFMPLKTEFDHDSIDGFLKAKLDEAGLAFSPEAPPRQLIRRVSIALTGLPPTPQQSQAFVDAYAKDADAAYEHLVEQLLDSPHFGERWAQHWLDVIRWAETNGSESNLYRKNAWMYRDYVVDAFNQDKPYDQFITEQIAGDVLGHGDATGYLVAGPHVPAATVGQEPTAIRQARADRMDEILQTVGASVMGVTIGCARCHNHKFDPISIQDYYRLSAVFQDIEFGSRFPELSPEHPRVIRHEELTADIDAIRSQMRRQGWAWVEDWSGFEEVHFPPQTVREMRIQFEKGWVQADELEIFEAGDSSRNVAKADHGTVVTDNPATHIEGKNPESLADGVFGTQVWRAKNPSGQKERPWLHYTFAQDTTIDQIRISTNREDFFETDYLDKLNKNMHGDFAIQFRDANGNWKTFAKTSMMRKRTQDDSNRSALVDTIQQAIEQLSTQGPQMAFLGKLIEPVDTFVFSRGSPENPRKKVNPAAPEKLNGQLDVAADASGPERRLAFAHWLTKPENPLTARVMVNRLWHHLYGNGIVPTPSDFGKAGAPPTHPEMLDWMAEQFIESGWSMKSTIRSIVMSDAFRQSSLPNDDGMRVDASAQLLWRFPPRRVEAEVIRDSILLAAGNLDDTVGGPSYRIHNVKARYAQWEVIDNYSDPTWRRMLYQERMRRVDDRIFTAFDFPDCGQIRAKRPVSTTPLQALNLMNSPFVVTQSEAMAERVRREAGNDTESQVQRCYQLLFCRDADESELQSSIELVRQHDLALLCRVLFNTNEFAFLP